MIKRFLILLLMPILLMACSGKPTSNSIGSQVTGDLVLQVSDSYHLSDSTLNWTALVKYQIDGGPAPYDTGSIEIPSDGRLGSIYTASIDSVLAGGHIAVLSVGRPFVILGRKDNISAARFEDSMLVAIPQYSFIEAPLVDIWAFHPYHLVVYFKNNVDIPQADTVMRNFGVQILSRNQTFIDSTLFYFISTEQVGYETDLKPQIENTLCVRSVYFDVFGHSYF
jgi:hypothetical protein